MVKIQKNLENSFLGIYEKLSNSFIKWAELVIYLLLILIPPDYFGEVYDYKNASHLISSFNSKRIFIDLYIDEKVDLLYTTLYTTLLFAIIFLIEQLSVTTRTHLCNCFKVRESWFWSCAKFIISWHGLCDTFSWFLFQPLF